MFLAAQDDETGRCPKVLFKLQVTSHSAPLIPSYSSLLSNFRVMVRRFINISHRTIALHPLPLQFLLLFFQHGKAFYDAINDGLRTCGAAGDIDIDGDRLVHAAKHIIALAEDAAA